VEDLSEEASALQSVDQRIQEREATLAGTAYWRLFAPIGDEKGHRLSSTAHHCRPAGGVTEDAL